ncbi:hypothetical protein, partial [Klebsiella variicola]|uniref:hypothetical protein n=2 Tax=Klebsiella pneumoniae complex TaxID=3390273 RepID=UPI001C4EBE23
IPSPLRPATLRKGYGAANLITFNGKSHHLKKYTANPITFDCNTHNLKRQIPSPLAAYSITRSRKIHYL